MRWGARWRTLVVLTVIAAAVGSTAASADTSGRQLWVSRYDGPDASGDLAHALPVSPDGSKLFVTGESFGTYEEDFATVAYDSGTGGQLWEARYDGPVHSYDLAKALAVAPTGRRCS